MKHSELLGYIEAFSVAHRAVKMRRPNKLHAPLSPDSQAGYDLAASKIEHLLRTALHEKRIAERNAI